ncbi:MAG: hypothetical protein ACI4MT_01595 [Christensenellales bacterium]
MSLTIQDVLDVQTKSRRDMRDSYDDTPSRYNDFEQRFEQKFAPRQNGYREDNRYADNHNNFRRYETEERFDGRYNREYAEPKYAERENGYDDYATRYSSAYNNIENYSNAGYSDTDSRYGGYNAPYTNENNVRNADEREINYFGQDPAFANLRRQQNNNEYASSNYNGYTDYRYNGADDRFADRNGDRFLENARREMNSDYTNENMDLLYDRLSYTSTREQNPRAIAPRRGLKMSGAKSPKGRTKNVKGKIILAVYIAVIVLVATLIIVNAAGINAGTAVTSADTGAYSVSLEGVEASNGYAYSDYGYVVNTNWFDRLCDSLKM